MSINLDDIQGLLQLIIDYPIESIILLLLIFFLNISLFKRFIWIQLIYNGFTNMFPFIKKEHVMIGNFSKKKTEISEVKKDYYEQGCLFLINDYTKELNKPNINLKNTLEKIVEKREKTIQKAKKRRKHSESLIYIGFPHIPLGFLDGYLYSDLDEVILYEYQSNESESIKNGFFELYKKYNTDLKICTNFDKFQRLDKEIALKIEQSFPIKDADICNVVKVSQIISIGIPNPKQGVISNYAQIDLYQKEFKKLLNLIKNKGVNTIHLFATTPPSLSFSLGRVIQHYHPDIIVYNYNNNQFDWAIKLKELEVLDLINKK